MSPLPKTFFGNVGALALIGAALFFLLTRAPQPAMPPAPQREPVVSTQGASVNTVTPPEKHASVTKAKAIVASASSALQDKTADATSNQVARIESPYPFSSQSSIDVSAAARSALVNILCAPKQTASENPLRSISGSGVIIDPRGVILTNAHVAQYVLLSEDPRFNILCVVRAGAPAKARWTPEVLYLPPVWVEEHASQILTPRPTGTGEHDYALLVVSDPLAPASPDTTPIDGLPYLPYDAREAAGFEGDQVLVASYPAEFIDSTAAQYNLFPVSSITVVRRLFTFDINSIDVLSLGGIVEAQGGSSGGAVVSVWSRLVALIATTSQGTTAAERDLHALTLSYINRDLAAQSGSDLAGILGGDVAAEAKNFYAQNGARLTALYGDQLLKH